MRTFFDAVREDTGEHMLDSGGHYGRHHEQPAVAVETPAVTWDTAWADYSGTISTAHFLTEAFNMRDDLNTQFDTWVEGVEGSWFECGAQFMQEQGYVCHKRGNVCNEENDLTQVYVYEVWGPKDGDDKGGDWFYIDDAVTVLYIHTGCDVRGGYTRPYFADSLHSEYVVPFDLNATYYIEDCHTLDDEARRSIDEDWEAGASNYPFGQLEESVKRWFPWTFTESSRVALLNTGDVVRIMVTMPYMGR